MQNIFKILILSWTMITSIRGKDADTAEIFKRHELLPDVIDTAPTGILSVKFSTEIEVKLGNELTPTVVKNQPKMAWDFDPNTFYTLIMTDPDAPSRKSPAMREWIHWLVGNIPGDQIEKGDILAEFISSGPNKGTALHRYTFLLFQQPGKLAFDYIQLKKDSKVGRANFSTRKFATKYGLGTAVAGNFYLSQWDSYVDIMLAGLKD